MWYPEQGINNKALDDRFKMKYLELRSTQAGLRFSGWIVDKTNFSDIVLRVLTC